VALACLLVNEVLIIPSAIFQFSDGPKRYATMRKSRSLLVELTGVTKFKLPRTEMKEDLGTHLHAG
jgi:hypothetical protein